MKLVFIFGIAAAVVCSLPLSAQRLDEEQIFSAMRDEAQRTLNELRLPDTKAPYYVEYKLTVMETVGNNAILGAKLRQERNRGSRLDVGVRVGDYTFDNTNYLDIALSFFGSSDDEEGFRGRRTALAPDYQTLRRELWMATDAAYKGAAEAYSKKKAALRNRLVIDTIPDFTREEKPVVHKNLEEIAPLNESKLNSLIADASAVFKDYPEIRSSEVGYEHIVSHIFYYNTEGVTYSKTEVMAGLEAVIIGQSSDGMPITRTYTAFAPTASQFPESKLIVAEAKKMAENFRAAISAEVIENYSGPVIFSGQAAGELFAQYFAPNLVAQRQPLSESGFVGTQRYSAFQNKIGGRVLPEFLSMVALPKATEYKGTPLLGSIEIDDEGIYPPDSLLMVEKGYLRALFSSRIPTRRVKSSNGHARGGAPMISNLRLVSNDASKTLSDKDLVARMMKLCKDRELPYGIIVRSLLNENLLFTRIFRMTGGDFPMTRGEPTTPILEIVKVFPDGREEVLRGAELAGVNAQNFKDIIAIGNNENVYSYLASAVVSSFITGGSQFLPVSLIVPDILFEDMEIRRTEQDFPKLPIIPSPLVERK